MNYEPDPTRYQPRHQWTPPPRRRRVWPVVTLALVVIAAGITGIVLAVTSDDDAPIATAVPPTVVGAVPAKTDPKPITRAQLMTEYAKIAQMDTSATPEFIDEVAQRTCDQLVGGTPTDEVISKATSVYGAQATEVIRLLASYKCPKELAEFK